MKTRSDIHHAIKRLLEREIPWISVFVDDGSNSITNAMLDALGAGEATAPKGVCIAISPILASKRVDSFDTSLLERCELTIHLRENPDMMPVPHDESVTRVIQALLKANAESELDEMELADEVTRLVPEDEGFLTTAINFSILIETTN